MLLAECLLGCAAVLVGMFVALGLARLAANLVIIIIAIAACLYATYSISHGHWFGWFEIVFRSFATGGLAALLSLPVLPFSSFRRGRGKK